VTDDARTNWSVAKTIGCAAFGIAFVVLSSLMLLFAIFGQCGAWADADCVQPSRLETFALFPGVPVVLAIIGYFLFKSRKRPNG
jgi:ABC-type Na+ efflux pump permease subunit